MPWVCLCPLLSFISSTVSNAHHLAFRQAVHHAYPSAWIFSACPPDPSERCISLGFYAVIGASAMLGGVTRMTSISTSLMADVPYSCIIRAVSLVVILFEVRGAHCHFIKMADAR